MNKKTFKIICLIIDAISLVLLFLPLELLLLLTLMALAFFIAFAVTKERSYWLLSVKCLKGMVGWLGGFGARF